MKDLIKPARTFVLSAISFIFSAIAAVMVITALTACAGRSVSSAPKPNTPDPSALAWNKDAKKTMRAFGSEDELKNYFRQLAEERKRALERTRREHRVILDAYESKDEAAAKVAVLAHIEAARVRQLARLQHLIDA